MFWQLPSSWAPTNAEGVSAVPLRLLLEVRPRTEPLTVTRPKL
jgi:hypothetical protein